MNYSFHPDAEDEFQDAIAHYEERRPGLGFDFAIEVRSAIQHILEYPKAWPILKGEVRRCLTYRFPYGVLYSNEPDRIFVVAVMHLRRDPDYWRGR